jgi:hypothetical protein
MLQFESLEEHRSWLLSLIAEQHAEFVKKIEPILADLAETEKYRYSNQILIELNQIDPSILQQLLRRSSDA